MRKNSELHLLVLVVIGHVVVTDQVDDGGGWNGCFEDIGLRYQPRAELAPVADALDTQTVAVNPDIAAQGRADGVQNILRFIAVLIAKNAVREFLAIARRSAIVDHQGGPAEARIHLISKI